MAFDLEVAGGQVDAFAVFDGVGGMPGGSEASQTAARFLRAVLAQVARADQVLPLLSATVAKATRGMSTAALLLSSTSGDWIASAGDSSVYVLAGGRPMRVNQHDSAGHGHLTAALGGKIGDGHAVPVGVVVGTSLLLCTDGIDAVLPSHKLVRPLSAPISGMGEAVDRLVADVLRHGAPDNATVVLARRIA
ncbi:MAG TPA: hypothetical protein VM327_06870 [Candidatus Thermoplasmatota archaeon]|nr:hypothetical protein [Candidatus Thermoplasmatota archaeon]